jgi:hypothetical protein
MPEKIERRGGARPGAGRKAPIEGPRKQRQMRATEQEWALIKAFERIVKKGDRAAAEEFIGKFLKSGLQLVCNREQKTQKNMKK